MQRFWAVSQLTGNYPETGLGEINGDVLEADLNVGISLKT